jgi:hypothetical protein
MNTTSASHVEAAEPAVRGKVLVWDAPVRVFHWLMVLSFAGAWLTAESERWQQLHVTLGYTMAGLLVFAFSGLVGSRHARFSSDAGTRRRGALPAMRCAASPSTTPAQPGRRSCDRRAAADGICGYRNRWSPSTTSAAGWKARGRCQPDVSRSSAFTWQAYGGQLVA